MPQQHHSNIQNIQLTWVPTNCSTNRQGVANNVLRYSRCATKTSDQVTESRHKGSHIQFQSSDTSNQLINAETKGRSMAQGSWRVDCWWVWPFRGERNILQLDCGEGCKNPMNTLKWGGYTASKAYLSNTAEKAQGSQWHGSEGKCPAAKLDDLSPAPEPTKVKEKTNPVRCALTPHAHIHLHEIIHGNGKWKTCTHMHTKYMEMEK